MNDIYRKYKTQKYFFYLRFYQLFFNFIYELLSYDFKKRPNIEECIKKLKILKIVAEYAEKLNDN